MNRKHWTLAVILLALLSVGLVWAAGYFRKDPQVAKVQQLRTELMSEGAERLPEQQRREKWEQFRDEVEKLTPEQREQMWSQGRQLFIGQMETRLNEFFLLPKDQQIVELDKQIDEMERHRKERATRPRDRSMNGSDQGPGGWRNASQDQRNQWRKRMLDSTNPEMRAKFVAYGEMMKKRRQERGLSASPWGN